MPNEANIIAGMEEMMVEMAWNESCGSREDQALMREIIKDMRDAVNKVRPVVENVEVGDQVQTLKAAITVLTGAQKKLDIISGRQTEWIWKEDDPFATLDEMRQSVVAVIEEREGKLAVEMASPKPVIPQSVMPTQRPAVMSEKDWQYFQTARNAVSAAVKRMVEAQRKVDALELERAFYDPKSEEFSKVQKEIAAEESKIKEAQETYGHARKIFSEKRLSPVSGVFKEISYNGGKLLSELKRKKRSAERHMQNMPGDLKTKIKNWVQAENTEAVRKWADAQINPTAQAIAGSVLHRLAPPPVEPDAQQVVEPAPQRAPAPRQRSQSAPPPAVPVVEVPRRRAESEASSPPAMRWEEPESKQPEQRTSTPVIPASKGLWAGFLEGVSKMFGFGSAPAQPPAKAQGVSPQYVQGLQEVKDAFIAGAEKSKEKLGSPRNVLDPPQQMHTPHQRQQSARQRTTPSALGVESKAEQKSGMLRRFFGRRGS